MTFEIDMNLQNDAPRVAVQPARNELPLTPLAFRRLFPIFKHSTYLNSCAHGALGRPVAKEVEKYIASWGQCGSEWPEWSPLLEGVRSEFGRLVGAASDEVGLTYSASTGLGSIASSLDWAARPRVLMSALDFPTVGHVWLAQEARGAKVQIISAIDGRVAPENLESAIDHRTQVVSVPHVSYRNGFRSDLKRLGDIAHANGSLFVVDASQSVGVEPLDVHAIGIDVLVTGTYKFLLGMPGLAFLYVRQDLADRLQPSVTGWNGQMDRWDGRRLTFSRGARRFQTGSFVVPACYAARAALRLVAAVGPPRISAHISTLTGSLVDWAGDEGLTVTSPSSLDSRSAIVTIAVGDAPALVEALRARRVICSERDGALRVSFHYYNRLEDISPLTEALLANRQLLRPGPS